ncbi:MAG: hypothetical protein R3F54_03925 [Alphaproteobacteria bacterium]
MEITVEIAKDVRVRVARATISDLVNKPGQTKAANDTGASTVSSGEKDRADVPALRQERGLTELCCASSWSIWSIIAVCIARVIFQPSNLFPRADGAYHRLAAPSGDQSRPRSAGGSASSPHEVGVDDWS